MLFEKPVLVNISGFRRNSLWHERNTGGWMYVIIGSHFVPLEGQTQHFHNKWK